MKTKAISIPLGLLAGLATTGHATIIGFGQLGGNNIDIDTLGSNAAAAASGLVVTNGATPNISLTWEAVGAIDWETHSSANFAGIEGLTVGGGDWDNEGSIPRIAQLDGGNHTITFTVDSGYALVLNSFDFGHSPETSGDSTWDLTLSDSGNNVVWSSLALNLNNQNSSGSQTISPGYTGADGETYTLEFDRTAESYNSDGRHALDNLSFNQITVPEPSSAALLGLGGLALILRRRK